MARKTIGAGLFVLALIPTSSLGSTARLVVGGDLFVRKDQVVTALSPASVSGGGFCYFKHPAVPHDRKISKNRVFNFSSLKVRRRSFEPTLEDIQEEVALELRASPALLKAKNQEEARKIVRQEYGIDLQSRYESPGFSHTMSSADFRDKNYLILKCVFQEPRTALGIGAFLETLQFYDFPEGLPRSEF